jgi:GGDEF domain-containing protein
MPNETPFNPFGGPGFQRARTMGDILRDAHGRRLNALTEGMGTEEALATTAKLPFGTFVDQSAKQLEEAGDQDRARAIRDWQNQEAAGLGGARAEEANLRSAQAGGALPSGLGVIGQTLNPFGGPAGLGTREEQIEQAQEGSSFTRDAERLLGQGVLGFGDVASMGFGKNIQEEVIKGQRLLGAMPEFAGRDPLAGMTASEIRKRGEQATLEDLDQSGVHQGVSRGFRAAGELVGFFTPAGYVSRAGNLLKVAPKVGKVGRGLGRMFQNPIVNFIAAESIISEGEIRAAELRGDDLEARAMREGQAARLANAAAFAAFTPVAKIFGRIAQNGALRVSGKAATNAKYLNATLSELPNLWQKVRSVGAHTVGKAGEFVAFGFAPNVYRPGPDGKTEFSPWFTTILNPAVIAGAATKGEDREKWLEAATGVLEHGVSHAAQGGVTGGILGVLGARGARLGERGTPLGFKDLVRPGPRQHTDPAAQARLEAAAARGINLRSIREVRATLPPAQRKALKEALRGELETNENPEALLQNITEFVHVAAEQQKRVLQENGALPKDMPTLGDQVRAHWERELGPEVFKGRAKDTESAGTGVTFELKGDPERVGRPGRTGEVLETFEANPADLIGDGTTPAQGPAQAPIRLARVRFEDGTLGIVEADRLGLTGSPGSPRPEAGEAAGPARGGGEKAAQQDKPGTTGRVIDQETGAVGELVRGHTDSDGRPLVDVQIGGELRTFPAGRFKARDPQPLTETTVGTAPEQGPQRATPADTARVLARDINDMARESGGAGLVNRMIQDFGLTVPDALQHEGRLIREGVLSSPEDRARHQETVQNNFYAPNQKPQRGRGGNILAAYKGLRRRFFSGKPGKTGPATLLGRMKATLDAMSPQQRERVLEGVEDFLPHEKAGEGIDLLQAAIEPPAKAPERPSRQPELKPDKAQAEPAKAQEPAKALGIPPKEKKRAGKVTVPVPKDVEDTGERRRAQDKPPADETPDQRRIRRLEQVGKARKKQSFTDKLTGMHNTAARRRATDRVDQDPEQGWLLVDGKGIKGVNNKLGQEGGDNAIRKLGDLLKALAEKAGLRERLVFREGGDEFAVGGDKAALEKLRELLKDAKTDEQGESLSFHVPEIGDTFKDAAKRLTEVGEKGRTAEERAEGAKADADRLRAAQEKTKPEEVPEQDRAEAEQTARAREADREEVEIPEETPQGPVTRGRPVEIRQEGTTDRVPGEYAYVPIESLLPSHAGPEGDFKPSEGYPKGLQPRDYQNDSFEQDKVRRIVSQFDPAELVNNAPRASEGPPSVAWDPETERFAVLNGNGRGMGMMDALQDSGKRQAYQEFLAENASTFGLEAPESGQALVRIVPLNPKGEQARQFARRGNQPGAQRQKPIDRAAAESDMLTDNILTNLSSAPNTTVLGAISGPAGRAFRQALRHRLGASGNDLFQENGDFTASGKEFAEGMLALRAGFTPTDLRSFQPAVRRAVASSTMQLLEMRRNTATRADAGQIRDAMRFIAKELEGGKISLAEWNEQTDMFGRQGPRGTHGDLLVETIRPLIGKPRVLKDALAKLVQTETDAPGQQFLGGMRSEPQPFVDRLADAFKVDIPETTRAVSSEMEEAAAMGMPSPRNPLRRSELLPEHQDMANPAPPDPITGAGQGDTPRVLPLERDGRPAFEGAEPLPASKIVQAVRDFFSVPVLVGGTGARRAKGKQEPQARALFDSRGRVIRLARANDLVGLSHEIGHGLEKYLEANYRKDKSAAGIEAEILRLGKLLYPKAAPWNGWMSEGWGEFTRLWLTDPMALNRFAPKAAKWFDRNVDFGDAAWRTNLDKIRDMATQFVGQGSGKRVRAFRSGVPERSQTALQEIRSSFGQQWIDQGHPLLKYMRKLEKDGVNVAFENNPALAREALDNSHASKARIMAEDGMIDFAGNRTGASLKDAIARVGLKRYDELVDFLVARQAQSINKAGKVSGLDDRDAQVIIDKYRNDKDIQKAAGMVVDWHRGVLTYMKQAGAITQGEVQAMKDAYPFYVPFTRIKGGRKGGFGGSAGQGPQKLTGSGREIVDPIAASVAQASNFIRWAHSKNMQMRLANLADSVPGMGQHVRLAEPSKVNRAKISEDFSKELKDAGIDVEGTLGESKVLDWLEARVTTEGDVLFPVKRGDKPEGGQDIVWYEASPEFYKAVQSADTHRFGPVMDMLVGRPARLKRLGTTGLRPGFAVVNLVRDYFVGFMQSATRNPLTWTAEWAAGQTSAIKGLFGKEDGYLRMYRALGVEMSRQLSLDKAVREKLGANLGKTTKQQLAEDVKNFRAIRLAEKGIDGLRDLIGVFEAGPRIAEMRIQAKRMGIDPTKEITLEQSMRLAKAGRQVTVDFNAAGTYARQWNAAVPFFNVAIQGPRRMLEAYKRDRVGFAMKALGSITAPTLALWFANKDEDWYIDMPWWEKNAYWHFGDGIRIPRPFEVGTVFASMPEAAFDARYRKDPRALMEALAHAGEQFTPDFLPVLGREARDWLANEDSFTDAPIVPRIEEGLEEREQFGPQTTNVARELGNVLNVSPRKIDHAIRGLGGGVFGDTARAFGTTGGGGLESFNPLSRFRRRGGEQGASSQAVQDFFDMREELQKQVRSRLEPASPRQRAALKVLEVFARQLKKLREVRQTLKGEAAQAANLKEMRALARQAMERARKFLGE